MLKRPLIAIGLVLLVILGGVLIFNIPWGGNADDVVQDIRLSDKILDYADTNVKTSILESGPIINEDEHRQIGIVVGRDSVVLTVYRGYNGDVIKRRQYPNTEASYRSFLAALRAESFTDTQTSLNTNYLGACPRSSRYYFEMASSTENVYESWATDCSSKIGTFDGNLSDVRNLFQAQVPNYSTLTRNVNI